jgi:hypothetical protein
LSLVVQAGDGAKFPSTGAFNATIWPVSTQPTTANAEIVRVASISTDTFTITRAQESSSARTVVVGDQIAATITAKTLTDVELDQYPNTYLTTKDELIPANSQVIFDDYLELAASFEYELASGAELVIGDYATPLIGPGQEIGYAQITGNVNVTGNSDATSNAIISAPPFYFDGSPVIAHFFASAALSDTGAVGDLLIVSLFEGTVQISRLGETMTISTTAQGRWTITGFLRFTPTAGYHAYTATAHAANTTGTPLIAAGTGGTGSYSPAFLRFTKV